MKIVQLGGMLLPLILCAAMQANATVAVPIIDFEFLVHNDDAILDHGATYTEDGYLLENLETEQPSFATYGMTASGFTGSTSLINDNVQGVTRLSAVNGSLFSIYSIDVSELTDLNGATDSITFYGTNFNGGTVSQTFSIDGIFGSETFSFDSNFTDLAKVEWAQTDYFVQFDNITASPVPVPSSILLFGAVLTALAAAGKRRKQS